MRELPSCAPELFSLSIITHSPACHYRWLEARQAGKLVSPMECICLWAMDGFSLHQVQSRNAPATTQNDAVRAHKTWWMLVFCQSRCQGDVVWSELLVAFLWHFRACFSAVHEMLLDQSGSQGYLTDNPWELPYKALQDNFGGEDISSSPPFTCSHLSAHDNSHRILKTLLLRVLL